MIITNNSEPKSWIRGTGPHERRSEADCCGSARVKVVPHSRTRASRMFSGPETGKRERVTRKAHAF